MMAVNGVNLSQYTSKALIAFLLLYLSDINFTDATTTSTVFTIDYRLGTNLDDGDIELSRFSVSTQTRFQLNRDWTAQLDARAEFAEDDVGLGSINAYSSANRPLIDNNSTRVEFERAFIQWRKRAHSVTLGKQVTPWGVLDGVQITDRFDPVRRRDFVFTDVRPDRIARWGGRWRNQVGKFKLDASLALDGTVSQQAELGALFFNTSTRFTGRVNVANIPIEINTQNRTSGLDQSTFGVRVTYPLGQGDFSLLSFRGPDTDPILAIENKPSINQPIVVELRFKRRTLLGASYDVTLGETVMRGEVAYIPDQQVNIIGNTLLQSGEARRLLVGFGIDWNAPAQWFVNAQLAIDYIDDLGSTLVRPTTDTIVTLRAQRLFSNGRLLFKGELLGTLNEQDGVLRPELAYEYTDRLKLRTGIDWLFGDENGQFGQFKDNSRIWFAASYTF
jgi:hypothetical protein